MPFVTLTPTFCTILRHSHTLASSLLKPLILQHFIFFLHLIQPTSTFRTIFAFFILFPNTTEFRTHAFAPLELSKTRRLFSFPMPMAMFGGLWRTAPYALWLRLLPALPSIRLRFLSGYGARRHTPSGYAYCRLCRQYGYASALLRQRNTGAFFGLSPHIAFLRFDSKILDK